MDISFKNLNKGSAVRKAAIVAGTGFEGRNKVIRKFCRNGMPVTLRRELNNKYDANAIAVVINVKPFFGLFGIRQLQIGYIKSSAAKGLSKIIDSGQNLKAKISSYYAPPGLDHPRVSLEIIE